MASAHPESTACLKSVALDNTYQPIPQYLIMLLWIYPKFVLPNCQKKTKWDSFLASDFKLWLIQSAHNLAVYQSFTLKININVLVPSLLLIFTDSFPLAYKDTSSFRTKAYFTRIESLACTRMWLSHPDFLSFVLRITRLNQFIHLLSIK